MRTTTAALSLILLLAACGQPASSPSGAPVSPAATEAQTGSITPAPTPSGDGDSSPSAAPVPTELAWSEVEPAGGPAAREDHTWTVGPDGAIAYLFGGRDGETVYDDLWAYDLAQDSWSPGPLAVDGTRPAARFGHEAVWVDGVGLVVVFGQRGTTFYDDIWAYDPEADAWRQLPAEGALPVARYGSCAALGPDGRMWISHGFTAENARFADTLAYDFASGTWTDETPAGDGPVSRCLHGCWWTDDGALRLYAGQTTGATALGDLWQLDLDANASTSWQRLDGSLPAERNLYARARVGAATLVFGGQAVDESYIGDLYRLADDGSDAVEIVVDGASPSGRSGAELVFDAARGRLLLFGGKDAAGALGDLWSLDGIAPAD